MLERTSVVINDTDIEARIEVGLPAAGRKILGKAAAQLSIPYQKLLIKHYTINILTILNFKIKSISLKIRCIFEKN